MAVSAVNNLNGSGSGVFTQSASSDVNRDDFLRLLIAQLQHQDPLNPVDNQEFVAQLATFSSLEQETQQTKLMQQMVNNQNSSDIGQALSLIGKDVTVNTNRFLYSPGEAIEFAYQSLGSGNTLVEIVTDSGQVVMTDVAVATQAGENRYIFTGQNPDGSTLPPGIYNIRIGGYTSSNGENESLPTYMRGAVEGVNFQNGIPVLVVNGQPIEMSQISAVFERKG